MENELDNIASELMGTEPDVTTPEVQEKETSEVQKVDSAVTTPANPQEPSQVTPKLSRSARAENMAKETKAWADRQNQENLNKIKALEDKMKNYAPYEDYLPQLKAVLDEKRKQEQAQQFQQNPIQAQQQLMEQMLNERLAPFQQQQEQVQNEQTVNQNIDWMKQTYGEEAYKEVSPYMGQILNNTREQMGEQVADLLARNPDHLFKAAFGELALDKIREFNQNKQAGNQNKQVLAQQSAGVSRPNRVSRQQAPSSNNAIEQAAFDFLSNK